MRYPDVILLLDEAVVTKQSKGFISLIWSRKEGPRRRYYCIEENIKFNGWAFDEVLVD